MVKKIIFLALIITTAQRAAAQEYIVQGTTPDLHLSHQVAVKETWYSIGRTYNLVPKDIAAYNKLSLAKPLEIGQGLQIPLTANNFAQDDSKAKGEAFVPVYHVVQPKEWLYRISVNYNKVPVETLQKWNAIGKDGAKPGSKLIVGYLKVKDANATLAPKAPERAAEKSSDLTVQTPVSRDEPKKPVPAPEDKRPEPVAETAQTGSETKPAAKEGSYFKNLFDDGGRTVSGVAGIFKSTSGWKDGKYYALMSNVPVGTILKISYPSTGKSVYAKVLGELPEMKESAGLGLRISDAAAYELGSPESKFSVEVKY